MSQACVSPPDPAKRDRYTGLVWGGEGTHHITVGYRERKLGSQRGLEVKGRRGQDSWLNGFSGLYSMGQGDPSYQTGKTYQRERERELY